MADDSEDDIQKLRAKQDYDYKCRQLVSADRKWQEKVRLAKYVIRATVIIFCIYMIMGTFEVIAGKDVSIIHELANFVKSVHASGIILSITTLMTGGAWYHERRGKKRAIEKVGELENTLENQDPYNASSGLTSTGDTPKDDHHD